MGDTPCSIIKAQYTYPDGKGPGFSVPITSTVSEAIAAMKTQAMELINIIVPMSNGSNNKEGENYKANTNALSKNSSLMITAIFYYISNTQQSILWKKS